MSGCNWLLPLLVFSHSRWRYSENDAPAANSRQAQSVTSRDSKLCDRFETRFKTIIVILRRGDVNSLSLALELLTGFTPHKTLACDHASWSGATFPPGFLETFFSDCSQNESPLFKIFFFFNHLTSAHPLVHRGRWWVWCITPYITKWQIGEFICRFHWSQQC